MPLEPKIDPRDDLLHGEDSAVCKRVRNVLVTRLATTDGRLVDGRFDIGLRCSWHEAIQRGIAAATETGMDRSGL